MYGHTHTVEILVKGGADLNIQGEVSTRISSSTVVYITACKSMLILFTVPLQPQQDDGLTALMCATLMDHSETVRSLIKCGADPNVQNKVCVHKDIKL